MDERYKERFLDRRHFAECDSTNDKAREWARECAPDGAVVTAGYQTAGRGQRGREWQAAAGENVLMTVILHPPYALADAWRLGFVAAVAVAEALRTFGVNAELKWPNDILVDGKKIGGILVETLKSDATWSALVGIGVNDNQTDFDGDAAFDTQATSLRLVSGKPFDIDDVALMILERLQYWEDRHRTDGFPPIAESWRQHMARDVTIRRGDDTGLQRELGDDGRIHVELPDGTFEYWGTVSG